MEKGDTFRVHVRYVSHENIYEELTCGARTNVGSHRLMDVDDRESRRERVESFEKEGKKTIRE